MTGQDRRGAWLPLVLAGLLAVSGWAADEGEWAPEGDHMKPRPQAPVEESRTPSLQDALARAAGSPGLKGFGAQLAQVESLAREGNYSGARDLAQKAASEVANVGVTAEFIGPRAALTAAFTLWTGQLQGLLGQPTAAGRTLGTINNLDVSDDFKALAAEADAWLYVLAGDTGRAASLERRAMQRYRGVLQPALAGANLLYDGRPDAALATLKPALGKGQNAGLVGLYAAASALALNRLAEAATYFGRPEVATAAIWPQYYLVAGLLEGAGGGMLGARTRFDEGARREQGSRSRANQTLAAVARLAGGDVPGGTAALTQVAASTPVHYRAALADLLANPTPAAATTALSNPAIWLLANGYRPGTLRAVSGADLPAESPTRPGDVTVEPATSPAGQEASATPAAEPALPPVTAGGGTAGTPARDTSPPAVPGIDAINPATQAARAYRTAVELIANHRYREASIALDYALANAIFPEALLARGQLRYLRADYRGALTDYDRAVRLRPDWAEAVYSLAQVTAQLGDRARAADLYAAALDLGLPPTLADYARSQTASR